MTRTRRAVVAAVAVVAAGALALAVPACSSNNPGQIVGKWIVPSEGSGQPALIYEFTEDGRFTLSTAPDDGKTPPQQVLSGRYTLRSGTVLDTEVEFPEDERRRERDDIEINGDTLTITDNGQTQVFTRMK